MKQALERWNKILVVDDEDDMVRALIPRLSHAGFVVLSASDGPTALNIAALEQPDVIVLDIGLPGPDGHQVAQQLKSNPETCRIPIIFFSARATDHDIDRGWNVGAAGFLAKIAGPGEIAGSEAVLRAVKDTHRMRHRRSPPAARTSYGPAPNT
jgi:DNA-binding response OmpR family regulator